MKTRAVVFIFNWIFYSFTLMCGSNYNKIGNKIDILVEIGYWMSDATSAVKIKFYILNFTSFLEMLLVDRPTNYLYKKKIRSKKKKKSIFLPLASSLFSNYPSKKKREQINQILKKKGIKHIKKNHLLRATPTCTGKGGVRPKTAF